MDFDLYTKNNLFSFIHRYRLNRTLKLLDRLIKNYSINIDTYSDFGCHDGIVTEMIAKRYKLSRVIGYDHFTEALETGRKRCGETVCFKQIDLNTIQDDTLFIPSNLITSFEVLEHVRDQKAAIGNILKSFPLSTAGVGKGILLISVPIETGLVGLVKFIVKRLFYKQKYIDSYGTQSAEYAISLIKNERMEKYRNPKAPDHMGFDYRSIVDILRGYNIEFHCKRIGITQYFIVLNNSAFKA